MNSADESPVHQRTRLRKSTGDANVRQQFLDDTASRNQSEAKDFGKGSNRRSSISNSRRLSLRGFGRSSRTSLGGSQDVPQPVGPMATSQHSRGLSQDMADMDLNRNRRECHHPSYRIFIFTVQQNFQPHQTLSIIPTTLTHQMRKLDLLEEDTLTLQENKIMAHRREKLSQEEIIQRKL